MCAIPAPSGGGDRGVTISVGVALFGSGEGVSRESILIEADLVMYDAKEAGRGRYAIAATGGVS